MYTKKAYRFLVSFEYYVLSNYTRYSRPTEWYSIWQPSYAAYLSSFRAQN